MSPPESLWRLLLQAGGSCQLCRHPWQQTLVAIECLCRLKLLQCVKLSFLLPFLRLADEPALPRTDIKLLFAGFLGFSSRVRPLPLALKPRSAFRSQLPFFFSLLRSFSFSFARMGYESHLIYSTRTRIRVRTGGARRTCYINNHVQGTMLLLLFRRDTVIVSFLISVLLRYHTTGTCTCLAHTS